MADDTTPKGKSAVQLTPGAPAKAKLASVTPGPKMVKVSVPKAKAIVQTPVASADPVSVAVKRSDPDLIKKGALLDQIVDVTGVKRSDAKSVMDALFSVMGDHLGAEKTLQIPPLGKVKVVKSKPVGQGATALTLRVRTPNTE